MKTKTSPLRLLRAPPLLLLLRFAAAEPLLVIGAGLGRTGTDSLRAALNDLGFGPTYHMREVLGVPGRVGDAYERGDVDAWAELGDAGGEAEGKRTWDDVFRGYRSAVDHPSQVFAVQLAEKYSEAKVVLTVRSSADEWHESINAAWCRIREGGETYWLDQASSYYRGSAYFDFLLPFEGKLRKQNAAMDGAVGRIFGEPYDSSYTTARVCLDREYAVRFYEVWNQYIMESIPGERLLVLESGDPGAGRKLGIFLGLDEGAAASYEYPHLNSRREFGIVIFIRRVEEILTLLLPVLLYIVGKKLKRQIGSCRRGLKQD